MSASRETSTVYAVARTPSSVHCCVAAAKSAVSVALQAGARLVLFHAVHLNITPYGPANPSWLKTALRQEAVEMAEPIMRFAQTLGVPVICESYLHRVDGEGRRRLMGVLRDRLCS